jgi:asparagine synthase (glutamine-hydrolysing)
MCRIAGAFIKDSKNLSDIVTNMCDAMKNGGPDDFGMYVDDEIPLALGHRRLSIIDLTNAGHQPMHSSDSRLILTFNGEIYNYLEIKEELKKIGYLFNTETDTEVILNSYLEWGIDSFEKFRGMYAIVIFDKESNKIILSRDHSGIKPLYYYMTDDSFIFSSEIRGIKTINSSFHVNEDWQTLFLAFGYIPEPYTTLENVFHLPKGRVFEFDLQKLVLLEKSNKKNIDYRKEIFDENIAKNQIENLLFNSVESHLVSDAPLGVFLSGGFDSSVLAMLATKIENQKLINTISIDFDDVKFSEKLYQDLVVEKIGSSHHTFKVTKEHFTSCLPDILLAMDQPSIDAINSYFICKKANEIGLKVVMSGVGADEYFGGYRSFFQSKTVKLIRFIPKCVLLLFDFLPIRKYKRISYLHRKDLVGEYLFFRGIFSINEISRITKKSRKRVKNILKKITICKIPEDSFDRAQLIETDLYMQNQLLRDLDCMSMWHGLEARVPFLDSNLIKMATKIDSRIKIKNGQKKYLLKEIYKDLLPVDIITRPKMGFTFPFKDWLKNYNSSLIYNDIEMERIRKDFNAGKISWSKYWAIEILKIKS